MTKRKYNMSGLKQNNPKLKLKRISKKQRLQKEEEIKAEERRLEFEEFIANPEKVVDEFLFNIQDNYNPDSMKMGKLLLSWKKSKLEGNSNDNDNDDDLDMEMFKKFGKNSDQPKES